MYQVRNGVFETNSSSTHSICISKKPVDADGCHVDFHLGEFGWSFDEVDPADYLYTAIMSFSDWRELLDMLKDILDSHSITYTFEKPKWDSYGDGEYYASDDYGDDDCWLANGYVDHVGEARDFVDAVLNDEDMLMRLLFDGDSVVYTGCDSYEMDAMCYAAEPTIWKYDDYYDYTGEEIPNPNHDDDKYDYFFKGN